MDRGLYPAANFKEYKAKSAALLKQGVISTRDLAKARIERYIIGPIFNFDFFYSPIEEQGEKLELLGIDWRFDTSLDGHVRLPADQQLTLDEAQRIPEYVVVGHNSATLRESSLGEVFDIAERYVRATQEHFRPGIIGPFTLQTAVDKDLKSWVYDVAPRIGGGTNVHMSMGHPYGNSLWRRPMSTGRRIAMEIRRGLDRGRLDEIVTCPEAKDLRPAALHLGPQAVEDVVVFLGHHPVHRAGHQAHEPFSPHLRFVSDLGPGGFRNEPETQVALYRLGLHMEPKLRRPFEGRDAERRLHHAVPGFASLLPRRAELERTRADTVDALDRGHPTLCDGEVGKDREHTLRSR